jgi:pseudouridine-5'-phosphate glycosidase
MMKLGSELAAALDAGEPVVALESTLICHGMPKPLNGELAALMEARVRAAGALPATMAIVAGAVCAGLDPSSLQALADRQDVQKCSTRDLPIVAARGGHGATTISATIFLAARLGIRVMATGGLGGVHQAGEDTMDVSADLAELEHSPVAVVCSGIKSILDPERTMEQLETRGIPVVGYRADRLPAFYSAKSGISVPPIDDMDGLVALVRSHRALGMRGGLVIATPPPAEHAIPRTELDRLVAEARMAATEAGIGGPAQTPFMLRHMAEASGGRTVKVNYELAAANAALAGELAAALGAG